MDYTTMSPKEVRALIAKGEITGPTAGMCAGYAQANLVILPKDLAYDFLLFTQLQAVLGDLLSAGAVLAGRRGPLDDRTLGAVASVALQE